MATKTTLEERAVRILTVKPDDGFDMTTTITAISFPLQTRFPLPLLAFAPPLSRLVERYSLPFNQPLTHPSLTFSLISTKGHVRARLSQDASFADTS